MLSVCMVFTMSATAGIPAAAAPADTDIVKKAEAQNTYEVDLGKPDVEIGQDLFGSFFEDINAAAYGGLYAELVQNRSFEFFQTNVNNDPNAHMHAWSVVGNASVKLMDQDGMNEKNPYWVQVTAAEARAGLSNTGYDGIVLKKDENYKFSMRIKGAYDGGFVITLEEGGNILASTEIETKAAESWTEIKSVLTSNGDAKAAKLCVRLKNPGTVGLDVISLFPEHTYNNRERGLRADLVEFLKEMKPGFLRFPGGCVIEGINLDTFYDWKDSVGDISERGIMQSYWQAPVTPYYYQEYGLGFYEYFLLCEDLGAKPMPCLSAGVMHFWYPETMPLDQMQPFIDNALDLIEFANGDPNDSDQKWAKLRADMGHPEPFNLEYLEIGNEQSADQGYFERYAMFAEQIKKKYPDIKILSSVVGLSNGVGQPATKWLTGKGRDFSYANDEHFYMSPDWFFDNAGRYDVMDRKDDAYIFAGEYASHHNVNGQNREDYYAAISEAAFMTGFERNADIVKLSCYAPLFCKIGYQNWDPDMIWFDNENVYGTPSYHVGKMYGNNLGDHTFKDSVTMPEPEDDGSLKGKVGVGTWATEAVYDDMKVVDNATGKTLYENKFETGNLSDWTDGGGKWEIVDADGNKVIKQTNVESYANSLHVGDISWSDYTYTLRAKKLSGAEGFIVPFAVQDKENYLHYNLGGFANSRSLVERAVDGTKTTVASSDTKINSNEWYDIKIEVKDNQFKCYLNGELDCEGEIPKSIGKVNAFDGKVGLGTWTTVAEYDDIKVVDNDSKEVLYENDFADGDLGGWEKKSGNWEVTADGTLRQADGNAADSGLYIGDSSWKNYTYTLRAKKVSGTEGFLIPFAVKSKNTYAQLNMGGYTNTVTVVDSFVDGVRSPLVETTTKVETGKWYDIRLVVDENRFVCYIDNKLECEGVLPKNFGPIYTTSSYDKETGDIILKIVNGTANVQSLDVRLKNSPYKINPTADMIRYAYDGDVMDENSMQEPEKIVPEEITYKGVSENFNMELPAWSFTILRVHTKEDKEVIKAVEDSKVETVIGKEPNWPKTVKVRFEDGSLGSKPVVWEEKPESLYGAKGVFEVQGTVEGYAKTARLYLTVTDAPVVSELPFVDVDTEDWFYEYAEYMFKNNIMTGIDKEHFGPDVVLSRAHFATILHRMEEKPEALYQPKFQDVKNGEFYTDAVMWASRDDVKVINGYEDGCFGPADYITREQMALMLYRYAEYKGYDVSVQSEEKDFPDWNKVSGFAQDAVAWAVEKQLITGDQGKVNPQGHTSRAVCATILERFMEMKK